MGGELPRACAGEGEELLKLRSGRRPQKASGWPEPPETLGRGGPSASRFKGTFPDVPGRCVVGRALRRQAVGVTADFFPAGGVDLCMPRPVAAGILTIVGAFFILAGGVFFALVGTVLALFGFFSGLFLLGLLVGFLTLIAGLLMLAVPAGHTIWGVLAIVLALVSLPVALGGFLIGFILTLVGGILAVTWRRPAERVLTVEGHRVPPPGG